jgi:MoaA/NifB/PqqE/SkfB family radical SAM enzyme
MEGRSVEEYASPLFLAWQLTNRCEAACLACCEESGPHLGWPDELTREEALRLTDQIVDLDIPYVAFGGGEPMSVRHSWEIFERLSAANILIKLETNGRHIDDSAATRLHQMGVTCIQISLDGATVPTHQRMRPGSDFNAALGAIDRLVARGSRPQLVFVPTRLNIQEMIPTFELAVRHGCSAFVTGPLMRLGRAAAGWGGLACDDATWKAAEAALRERADEMSSDITLSIYPWDIVDELDERLVSPQAMMLVVPNGRVKLLNALPFSPADMRRHTLPQAWDAYRAGWRSSAVRDFIARCRTEPDLLRHANETWDMPGIGPG